jgi:hypothetical protein
MANEEKKLIKQFLHRLKNAVDKQNDSIGLPIHIINTICSESSSDITCLQRYIVDILDPITHSGGRSNANGFQTFKYLMLDILNQALNVLHFIDRRRMIDYLIINNERHRNPSEYLQYCRQSVLNAINCLNSVDFTNFNITTKNARNQHYRIKLAFTYAIIKVPMLFGNIELASERHRQNRKELLMFLTATTATADNATKIGIFFKCIARKHSCSKRYWGWHTASFLSNKDPITEG